MGDIDFKVISSGVEISNQFRKNEVLEGNFS
jgi:hypothetical protein